MVPRCTVQTRTQSEQRIRETDAILRFHCHTINTAQKDKLETVQWKKKKKTKCYKRLIYKQFAQISGLCGPQFLSYLPKHFTHLCRALYGDAILVDRNCPPIWPPEINRNIWSSLFLKSSSFSLES